MTTNDDQARAPVPLAIDRAKNQRGVLCARCDHLNFLGRDSCEKCGGGLYVDCRRCGKRNLRVYTRCQHCRRRLHGSLFSARRHHHHHRHSSFLRRTAAQLFQVLLILLGLLGVFGLLVLLYKR
jgi:predicted amidophosphoribosyltransferase